MGVKSPWEWTEADLLEFVRTQLQESIDLDYKACDALQNTDGKKNEVSKDVSAFANSAGGTIVYGIKEDQNHVAIALDEGYDPADIRKEWLEQVINSRIQPRIDGLRINQVSLDQTNPGRVAYVVHAPQSLRAPHQASDHRYYRRYNFQSVAMEDYEVRDVARRLERPILELQVTDTEMHRSGQNLVEVKVQFRVFNGSAATASFVTITVGLFWGASASFPTTTDWRWIEATERVKVARSVIASGTSNVWSPLTPGFTLVAPHFTLRIPTYEQDILTPRVVGLVRLDHDGGTAIYRIIYAAMGKPGNRLRLEPGTGDTLENVTAAGLEVPAFFDPRLS
jgi:hypothetical protein